MEVRLLEDIKEYYIIAFKFNNHKDIHVVQNSGNFMTKEIEAKEMAMKFMDERMTFVYQKADGSPYKNVLDELTARAKGYKYLLPVGYEIYMSTMDPGKLSMKTDNLYKGE